MQALPGVPKINPGLNPATWMLQISTPGMEKLIGIDFAEAYTSSNTFRLAALPSMDCKNPSPQRAEFYEFTMQIALNFKGPFSNRTTV